MNETVVCLTDLAKTMRLPASWLEAEAKAGRIPCLKIGRKLRFNAQAVAAALASRAATSWLNRQAEAANA